jgi:hypothetical protein
MLDDLSSDQHHMLRRSIEEAALASDPSIGLVQTVQHQGIFFQVTRRFVIADLAPLTFFHLVEPIHEDPAEAIFELYDRLAPLLMCRHRWTPLKRQSDGRIRSLGTASSGAHICKSCMAYALGGKLPVAGNSLS